MVPAALGITDRHVSRSLASKLAVEVRTGMDLASDPGRVELAQVVTETMQYPFRPALLFAAEQKSDQSLVADLAENRLHNLLS